MYLKCKDLDNAFDVMELEHCTVLLDNDIRWYKMFLVLKDGNIKNFSELSVENGVKVMREVALCEKALLDLSKHNASSISMQVVENQQFVISILAMSNLRYGVILSSKGYTRPYHDIKKLATRLKKKIISLQENS